MKGIQNYTNCFDQYSRGTRLTYKFKNYLVDLFNSNNTLAYTIYKQIRSSGYTISIKYFEEIETAKDKYFARFKH